MGTDKEIVSFAITLSGTWWSKVPEFSIAIDGREFVRDTVTESQTFTFDAELTESEHVLEIKLLNKSNEDVVQDKSDSNNSKIIKDMLLNIESIFINDIEIESLKWNNSEFIEKDSGNILKRCVNLGQNGKYQITLKSPIISWLLTEIERQNA